MSYYKELRDTWDGDSPFPSDDQFKEACSEVDRLRAEVDQLRKLVVKKDEALQSIVDDYHFLRGFPTDRSVAYNETATNALALTPASLSDRELVSSTELAELRADKERSEDTVASKQGVIDAVDRVLKQHGAIHASRAVAIDEAIVWRNQLIKGQHEAISGAIKVLRDDKKYNSGHLMLVCLNKAASLSAQARGRDEGK